jgi:hypothetical protein
MGEAGKLTATCPDCGCTLTIDAATGAVLHHRPAVAPPAAGKSFEELFQGLDDDKRRAEEVFAREQAAFNDRDRLMEERFREALKRAEESPDDEPPPSPFDFD